MTVQAPVVTEETRITYPESDGQPMADNTKQFRWIVTIKEGLDALFAKDSDVFVAGDLFWYSVEGQTEVRQAPDVLVAFGRPKGDRGSYLQWQEGGIAPQVVFEILSPSNTVTQMTRKFQFYERYGVEEYYIYDPDSGELSGYLREGDWLEEIDEMAGWVSPRLGVRFELEAGELVLYRPDGERFLTYTELMAQREQAQQRAEEERQRAEQAQQRAEEERRRAEEAEQRAEEERQRAEEAEQRAEKEHRRAEQAEQRAQRMAAQLRALGIEPEE